MAYTSLIYHIVFSTKGRVPMISRETLPRICEYIGGIIRGVDGQMLGANGMADHLHVATIGNPNIAVTKLLQLIKGNSSKWIHETIPELRPMYWQEAYGAFSVSPSALPELLAYIAGQEEHHRRHTFQEEFLALLERHGVKYDPRYIWR